MRAEDYVANNQEFIAASSVIGLFVLVCVIGYVQGKLRTKRVTHERAEAQRNEETVAKYIMYPREPRIQALKAASRYNWRITLRWRDQAGVEQSATANAPIKPKNVSWSAFQAYFEVDGRDLPIEFARDVIVHAADEETSERYSVYGHK